MSEAKVLHGDCRELMKAMAPDSIDSCVTDPPYSLGFMGKKWDGQIAFDAGLWREVFRVLKPGAHLIAFAAERTYHRLACAIEDAGFEVRHMGVWVSAQSFPKSLDVSKAIDKAAGAERNTQRVPSKKGNKERRGAGEQGTTYGDLWGGFTTVSAPATPKAAQWSGWGTALKTMEPYVLARKPLSERTVAANVLRWGTGALNIDGCRLPFAGAGDLAEAEAKNPGRDDTVTSGVYGADIPQQSVTASGRWPASVMVADLDVEGPAVGVEVLVDGRQPGVESCAKIARGAFGLARDSNERFNVNDAGIDGVLGPYTRHFRLPGTDGTHDEAEVETLVVCPKASTSEREAGLREAGLREAGGAEVTGRAEGSAGLNNPRAGMTAAKRRNLHPTVKPIALMRHLVRLVTPRGGTVLDPFAGSGSTGVAAVWEMCSFVGCELNDTDAEPYVRIARARIAYAERTPSPEIRTRKPKSKAGPSSDTGSTLL